VAELISNLFSNLPTLGMPRFGLNSVLDIAFIAFVAYRLLLWVKQTRAWTLFKGIAIILVVWAGATVLTMHVTTFIIEATFNIVAIALLVIFQPELRKALESIGKNRNIPFFSQLESGAEANSTKTVEEIADAALKMAAVKTGALIVIEQAVPLGDLETTGVPIDAVVSSQLLINIFEHNTPLHDGAVLVRENRVKAATCILPLTSNALSSDLGTRHRAAVGTSEGSDAYVLVVSEETGKISIAKDGKLYQGMSESDIKAMLLENIKPGKTKKRRAFGRGKKK